MGVMNENKKEKLKATREYLPSVESLSKTERPKHGKRVGKGFNKQKKLGKKLWREWFKSIEFIKDLK